MNQRLITRLEKKMANRDLKIAVIGLGYMGLPLSAAFAGQGIKVAGIDTDTERVKSIRKARTLVDTHNATGWMNSQRRRKPSEGAKR